LVRHCQSADAEGCTPSDFPLAHLKQAELDELVDRMKRACPGRFRETVEDVYALSPMQHGMLFHSLYAPEDGTYCVQTAFAVQGKFDFTAFKKAWETVIVRHSILRTGFAWDKLDHPVQIAYKRACMPVDYQDW